MIVDWEDLACIKDAENTEYNELKLWLRSQTQNSITTVSTISHPVHMLRSVLGAAIHEIRENLDQQIAILVAEAQTYHVRIHMDDYYRTRCDDWDGMLPTDIDEMGREECVGLMHAARNEIAWLVNEISRLECFISIEKQMDRLGFTERQPYLRPLERIVRQQDAASEHGSQFALKSVDSAVESSPRAASMELD